MMGILTIQTLNKFHVDKALLSVAGVDVINGITEYKEEEKDIVQAIIKCAHETVLLAVYCKIPHQLY